MPHTIVSCIGHGAHEKIIFQLLIVVFEFVAIHLECPKKFRSHFDAGFGNLASKPQTGAMTTFQTRHGEFVAWRVWGPMNF
jgi:hypothetical protein